MQSRVDVQDEIGLCRIALAWRGAARRATGLARQRRTREKKIDARRTLWRRIMLKSHGKLRDTHYARTVRFTHPTTSMDPKQGDLRNPRLPCALATKRNRPGETAVAEPGRFPE